MGIVLFVVFTVLAALLAERLSLRRALRDVRENHTPETAIVDPCEVFRIKITVRNQGTHILPFVRVCETLPPAFALCDASGQPVQRTRTGTQMQRASFTAWLRPGQEKEFFVPVTIAARGQYALRHLEVGGGDFLGLQEAQRSLDRYAEVVVAPREAPSRDLPEIVGGFLGDVSARRFLYEDPILTAGCRAYTGREPMKAIAWKQSAHTGDLLVYNYDHTMEPAVCVLLDVGPQGGPEQTQQPERLEACLSLARTVCRLLEERGAKYSFATNAVMAGFVPDCAEVREGLGARHFAAVLEALGRATGYASMPLERLALQAATPGTACGYILLTAGPADAAIQAAQMLRRKAADAGGLLVLAVEDPAKEAVVWQG
jgi:uncharacterized protein (DUF58 family)